VTGVRGMHADLVRAAGMDRHLEEGCATSKELHRPKIADGRFAVVADTHRSLAPHASVGAQGHIDPLVPEIPGALHQSEVALLDKSFAQ
jgi:hypothetical protein